MNEGALNQLLRRAGGSRNSDKVNNGNLMIMARSGIRDAADVRSRSDLTGVHMGDPGMWAWVRPIVLVRRKLVEVQTIAKGQSEEVRGKEDQGGRKLW